MKPSDCPNTIESSNRSSHLLFRTAILATLAGSVACASPHVQAPKQPENRVVTQKKEKKVRRYNPLDIKFISRTENQSVYEVCGHTVVSTRLQLTASQRVDPLVVSQSIEPITASQRISPLNANYGQNKLVSSSNEYQLEADYDQYSFKPKYEIYRPPSDESDEEKEGAEAK